MVCPNVIWRCVIFYFIALKLVKFDSRDPRPIFSFYLLPLFSQVALVQKKLGDKLDGIKDLLMVLPGRF